MPRLENLWDTSGEESDERDSGRKAAGGSHRQRKTLGRGKREMRVTGGERRLFQRPWIPSSGAVARSD